MSILARHLHHRHGSTAAEDATVQAQRSVPSVQSGADPTDGATFAAIGLGVLANALGIQAGTVVPSRGPAEIRPGWTVLESYSLGIPTAPRGHGRAAETWAQIEVLSFSWAASRRGAESLGTVANSSRANLLVTARPCVPSSQLYAEMLAGRRWDRVVFSGSRRRPRGRADEFLRLELGEAVIIAHARGWDSGDNDPIDEIGIICETLRYRYHPQNMDGSYGAPVAAVWCR